LGLRAALSRVLGPDFEIDEPERLSGGASRETWAFEARTSAGTRRRLILQRQIHSGDGAQLPIRTQAQLLRAAKRAGVPVPNVVVSTDDSDEEELGRDFCITEFVDGETIPQKILRSDEYSVARGRAVDQAASALARIHSIPLSEVPGLKQADQLSLYRDVYDGLGEPHPTFDIALRWLDANRLSSTRSAVVHGDFRNGNFIMGSEGLRAVIDWELAHIGDPMEDIGWLCVKSWRFGQPQPVGGLGSYERLFTAYERESMRAIDRGAARWWEVLGTFKWGVICILQAHKHLSGAERSVELAAIGRRVCEVEHDLLLLLAPDAIAMAVDSVPAQSEPRHDAGRPPHDSPSSGELLEAVEEFLRTELVPSAQGKVQFHARVAANVAGIVRRELVLADLHAKAHDRRLRNLGLRDERELSNAIRSGELEDRHEAVLKAIAETVRDKLLVANPKYLDSPRKAP
jgi:aminoglycoside phosphotransferase (APT) family kinase protein